MGLLTRLQLRDELRTALGERTDITDPQLDRWLNMGLSLVSQPEVRQHYELVTQFFITLVADQNVYIFAKGIVPISLAYNVLGFQEVEFIDATVFTPTVRTQDVRPRSLSWFTGRNLVSTAGGPRHYVRRGNTLEFNPIPAAADAGKLVRCTVWQEPIPFAVDTDVSPLLDYFDHALVLGGQYFAEVRLGYRELSVHTRQELQTYVNQKSDAGETDMDTDQRAELRHESPMPLA